MDLTTDLLAERVFVICYAALGLSMILQARRWAQVLSPVWSEANSGLRLGAIPLVVGAALVVLHPSWSRDPGTIVTALGWLALLKGLVCLLAPRVMHAYARRWEPSERLFRGRGLVVVVLAALASWHAFDLGRLMAWNQPG